MGAPSPIEAIQTLGRYTLLEKIGEGYLGSVYRGFDQNLGRAVAVRVLCDGIKWDAEIEEIYNRQCQSVAGLQHGLLLTRAPTPHKAKMPSVRARHHLKDGVRLAMTPSAQHDAFVGPFHDLFLVPAQ